MDAVRRVYPDAASFEVAWTEGRGQGAPPWDVAERVFNGLRATGFRLFHNGGLPRLDRRRGGTLQDEIVLAPGPRDGLFAVRFHLNHDGLGEVRARFWRPATRAPKVVASGDIGLLEIPPVRSIWIAEDPGRVAGGIVERILQDVMPWFDVFDDPDMLRETLFADTLPLVDASTALELLLAEFGPREARRFLRARMDVSVPSSAPAQNRGFELRDDRIAAIVQYYRL